MKELSIKTEKRTQFINIDYLAKQIIYETKLKDGILNLFVPHTTAGLTINENADPDVTTDMRQVLDKVIPWEDGYRHLEGNTAAHVKASMMGSSLQLIVENAKIMMGTWQSIYFCEFDGPRTRKIWAKEIKTS